MIQKFPKIFHLGTPPVSGLRDGVVEITEKLDGSQFAFGYVNGAFFMRSKGRELYPDSDDKLFNPAIVTATMAATHIGHPNAVFYGEAFARPRHNTLKYDRTPKGHIALFGASLDGEWQEWSYLKWWASILGCDVAPLLGTLRPGQPFAQEELDALLATESYLGGCTIEGVVLKNWGRGLEYQGLVFPFTAAKYVSEAFREKNKKQWEGGRAKNQLQALTESLRSEARWQKARQYLDELGELEGEPRDIGKLIRRVHDDIREEEEDYLKEQLWAIYGEGIVRKSTHGLAEWYKRELAFGE